MSLAGDAAGRLLRLPRPRTADVTVERDLRVPMADGAVLLADRWVARGAPARQPTVLIRSPYGRAQLFGLLFGRLLAERGLQVVVQSVRGTFGSGGEFNPFDERGDGVATLDWLDAQPWHDGRVGMTGPSYLGLTQWAIARDPRLAALAPSVTASQFHGQTYGGGSISLDTAMSWMVVIAMQERRLGPLHLLRGLRRLPPLLDQLPIGELDASVTGAPVPWFRESLQHSARDDPWWVARDFSAGIGEVRAPVQLVGGWHDIFLPWMLEDFAALRAAGNPAQLVVGPWTHTAPGAAVSGARNGLAWLRAHLLGDRRLLRDAPVQVHVGGGGGGWRELDAWPPPEATPLRLHLHPGGRLARAEPPAGAEPSRYRYDPADPTPSLGGPTLFAREPVVDNRPLERRADVLVFSTDVLRAPVEAIGPVEAELHVGATTEHFDVFARVCDVHPDGTSYNVCDALVRVEPGRFPVAEDGTTRVTLPLWPTAHRFGGGHRIRLQVSSGAHPRYARNPGTGEPPATARRLVAADLAVRGDAAHPSAVTLTVV
ncbi:MAG: CocE/NonD family hydrolase [Solirubrobacterales bacterium]|nr:CocE/NonD family hydrolase [Solirubrobacterales bacterium]